MKDEVLEGQTSIEDHTNPDYFMGLGIRYMINEQFEEAVQMFSRLIELEPSLTAYQFRALCQTAVIDRHSPISQVVVLVSDLTEALRLAVDLFESPADAFNSS